MSITYVIKQPQNKNIFEASAKDTEPELFLTLLFGRICPRKTRVSFSNPLVWKLALAASAHDLMALPRSNGFELL